MIRIPKGKIVKIAKDGADIMPQGVSLTLDSELSLSLKSDFSALMGNKANAFLSVISGAVRDTTGFGLSGQFKELGFKMWTGTDPVQFAFTVLLNMKHSAKTDVWDPAKILMKLPLPMEAQGTNNSGGTGGFGLLAPGPSILTAAGFDTKFGAKYSFRCGAFYLSNVVVEKVEPSFSTEVDDAGYPTWCSLTIDVTSLFTATTRMIDDFGFVNQNGENWIYE